MRIQLTNEDGGTVDPMQYALPFGYERTDSWTPWDLRGLFGWDVDMESIVRAVVALAQEGS